MVIIQSGIALYALRIYWYSSPSSYRRAGHSFIYTDTYLSGVEILRNVEGSKSIAFHCKVSFLLDSFPGMVSPALGCNYTSCQANLAACSC